MNVKGRLFTIAEVREHVKDLFQPNPFIYWTDLLLSCAIGWGALVLTVISWQTSPSWAPRGGWQMFVLFVLASLGLYRAVIFTHELTHLKKGTFRFFRFVWNAICGVPLMNPSITYEGVHMEHHVRDNYGTKTDGEYYPFGATKRSMIVLHTAVSFLLPAAFFLRFVLLTPLSFLHPKFREWLWVHASSLAIDLEYSRRVPNESERTTRFWMELVTFAYGATFIALMAVGVLPWVTFAIWYCAGCVIFLLNGFRTLAAHRYDNGEGGSMDVVTQFADSVNVTGNPITTPLWAPVALRYHGTHHLFPAMPYHNLGAAHRRLVKALPSDSVYFSTLEPSLFSALADLWRRAGEAERAKKA